ncbi:hypothetical protein Q31a_05320 [Aureliella helgolandensis]|uniref:Uncharacterized protein n=2 Tax=Aureliella helgolandensis TaxID=2527968 RepID=A0A518G0W6_9BACT|nr:hypothetical protein Q31a_05320 [Aureliella helgolandensis]
MTELLILMILQHNAKRLEYRTVDGEFRVAEIIDEQAFEFPSPPECARDPILKHLQMIFDVSPGSAKQKQLKVGTSQAAARCEISADYQYATITVVHPFTPYADLLSELRRFWRTHAANKGYFALLKFYLQSYLWKLEDLANQAVNRSRR